MCEILKGLFLALAILGGVTIFLSIGMRLGNSGAAREYNEYQEQEEVLLNQLNEHYPELDAYDLLIAGLEELLNQNRRES